MVTTLIPRITPKWKIYFAASIRGGRGHVEMYDRIIDALKKYGTVLTEHVGDASLTDAGEEKTDQFIFERDCGWITEADVFIAEVSNPSTGVGYEIALAQSQGKRIICFYRKNSDKKLSAMIAGNSYLTVFVYDSVEEFEALLERQFTSFGSLL